MLAPLATLVFLSALWLIAVLTARTLTTYSAKIGAALAGRSLLATQPTVVPVPVRVSLRSRTARPARAEPQWRAAA